MSRSQRKSALSTWMGAFVPGTESAGGINQPKRERLTARAGMDRSQPATQMTKMTRVIQVLQCRAERADFQMRARLPFGRPRKNGRARWHAERSTFRVKSSYRGAQPGGCGAMGSRLSRCKPGLLLSRLFWRAANIADAFRASGDLARVPHASIRVPGTRSATKRQVRGFRTLPA